jgi:hypothetical protein
MPPQLFARYEGQWREDVRDGQGTASWANGDSYIGEWKLDCRHGHGVFVDGVSGLRHVGEWSNDAPSARPSHACVLLLAEGGSRKNSTAGLSDEPANGRKKSKDESSRVEGDDIPITALPGTKSCDHLTIKKGQPIPALCIAVAHVKMVWTRRSSTDLTGKPPKVGSKAGKQAAPATEPRRASKLAKDVDILLTQESGRRFRVCVVSDNGEPVPADPTVREALDSETEDQEVRALAIEPADGGEEGNQQSTDEAGAAADDDDENTPEPKPIVRSIVTSATESGVVHTSAITLSPADVHGKFVFVIDDITPGLAEVERLPRVLTPFVAGK